MRSSEYFPSRYLLTSPLPLPALRGGLKGAASPHIKSFAANFCGEYLFRGDIAFIFIIKSSHRARADVVIGPYGGFLLFCVCQKAYPYRGNGQPWAADPTVRCAFKSSVPVIVSLSNTPYGPPLLAARFFAFLQKTVDMPPVLCYNMTKSKR